MGFRPLALSITVDLKRQTRKTLLKSRIFSGDCTIHDRVRWGAAKVASGKRAGPVLRGEE